MIFNKNLFFLFLIFLASCSSISPTNHPFQREKILSKKELTLLRYKKLRMKNFRVRKSTSSDGSIKSYLEWYKLKKRSGFFLNKQTTSTKKPTLTRKTVSPKRTLSKRPPEELKIEIEQNLAYFCFSPQKRSGLANQKDCKSFTSNALNRCQEKYSKEDLGNVLTCVKKNLRTHSRR